MRGIFVAEYFEKVSAMEKRGGGYWSSSIYVLFDDRIMENVEFALFGWIGTYKGAGTMHALLARLAKFVSGKAITPQVDFAP